MKGTSATRHEMLERNPQLKKYWLSRLLVGPILLGAQIEVDEWKRIRIILATGPIMIAIFVINMVYTPNRTITEYMTDIALIVFLNLCWILVGFAAYGYKNKQNLYTTGGVISDFKQLGRYAIWYGLIGVGISSGVGIFDWLKGWI